MFKVNRSLLNTELAIIGSVVKDEKTLPVLRCVRMVFDGAELQLTGSSVDVTLRVSLSAEGEAWSGCVPWQQLAALVKTLYDETVSFVPKDGKITIKAGTSKTVLHTLPASDFPAPDTTATPTRLTLNGDVLREAVRRALPCVSTEESRYAMRGLSFEAKDGALCVVATDGHRLAVSTIPDISVIATALIPDIGVRPLLNMTAESIAIEIGQGHVVFNCDGRILTARLIAGQFPNWRLIIPEHLPNHMEVDSESLSASLKRSAITRGRIFKTGTGVIMDGMKFTFARDALTVEVKENDRGAFSEEIAATSSLNGEATITALNPDYLVDFLATGEGKLICQWNDASSQFLLSWPDVEYRYVLMPMRV
jgi:DNA polymerase-3 subunit beta